MTVGSITEPIVTASPQLDAPAAPIASARSPGADWALTQQDRSSVEGLLIRPPFTPPKRRRRHPGAYDAAVGWMLDWLLDQPGDTWQDRWLASGADADGRSWRHIPMAWMAQRGHDLSWMHDWFFRALFTAFGADLIRPSLNWLVAVQFRRGSLTNIMAHCRDPEAFSQMQGLCSADPDVSRAAATRTTYRASLILAAKGGAIADITVGDLLELLDAEAATLVTAPGATHLFYRVLGTMNVFGSDAPATLRELRTLGQRTPEQLIDRYGLVCQPIRDLLVDYLKERQPALDYTSLDSLANFLGSLFWADLERHHPGIDTLHLPSEVAEGWKQRLRTVPKTVRAPDGARTQIQVSRINYRECLTPVRAFYLDLAHWAVEDPGRWAAWVAPSPIGNEEVNRRKDKQQRKSRMDARTRDRLPVLPVLRRTADRHRQDAAEVLDAARNTAIGQTFTAAGRTLVRVDSPRGAAVTIWSSKKTTPSGLPPSSRYCARPGSGLKNSPNCHTTAWFNTVCPPPAKSCRCCKSHHRKATPNVSSWSAPNSPKFSARSSVASAVPTVSYRWSPPTTTTNAAGFHHCRCCSSVASAASNAPSVPRRSAPCSTTPSPAADSPNQRQPNRCASPRTTSEGSSSPTPFSTGYRPTSPKS